MYWSTRAVVGSAIRFRLSALALAAPWFGKCAGAGCRRTGDDTFASKSRAKMSLRCAERSIRLLLVSVGLWLLASPAANASVPVATVRPAVSSAGALTSSGTWTNSPTSYQYAWIQNGISLGYNSSLTPSSFDDIVLSDPDDVWKVRVKATNGSGNAYADSLPVVPHGANSFNKAVLDGPVNSPASYWLLSNNDPAHQYDSSVSGTITNFAGVQLDTVNWSGGSASSGAAGSPFLGQGLLHSYLTNQGDGSNMENQGVFSRTSASDSLRATSISAYTVPQKNFTASAWIYLSSTSEKGAFFHAGADGNVSGTGNGWSVGVGSANNDMSSTGNHLAVYLDGSRWVTALSYTFPAAGYYYVTLNVPLSGCLQVGIYDWQNDTKTTQSDSGTCAAPASPTSTIDVNGYQLKDTSTSTVYDRRLSTGVQVEDFALYRTAQGAANMNTMAQTSAKPAVSSWGSSPAYFVDNTYDFYDVIPPFTAGGTFAAADDQSTWAWSNNSSPGTYQWKRCTFAGTSCTNISGETSTSYTNSAHPENDSGHVLQLAETATNNSASSGASGTNSPKTAILRPQGSTAPTVNASSVIEGTALGISNTVKWNNNTQTCASANLTPCSYRWMDGDYWYGPVNGGSATAISGATSTTFTPTASLVGHSVFVEVSASDNTSPANSQHATNSALVMPKNTTAPTLTGTLEYGQNITVSGCDAASWDSVPYSVSCSEQWQYSSDGTTWTDAGSVCGCTTYTIGSAASGKFLRVRLDVTINGTSTSVYASSTGRVSPQQLSAVSISGSLRDGQTLTAGGDSYNPSSGLTKAYTWYTSTDGSTWTSRGTGTSLTLGVGDVGKALKVIDNVSLNGGAFAFPSSAGSTVIAPKNTHPPEIRGIAAPGQRLSPSVLSTGAASWNNTIASMTASYAWKADGTTVGTSSTYLLTSSEIGKQITLEVTETVSSVGSASAGSTTAASDETGEVAYDVTSAAEPAITGDPRDGSTLITTNGEWNGTKPISFTYQWQKSDDGTSSWTSVTGNSACSTAQTCRPSAAEVGKFLRVSIAATNAGGTVAVTTAGEPIAPKNTTAPALSDTTPITGQTISVSAGASSGAWDSASGLTFNYSWRVSGKAVGTGSTYTVGDDDAGLALTVDVIATAANGAATVAASPDFGLVDGVAPANTSVPTIGPNVIYGFAIKGTDGSWSGTTPQVSHYQWQVSSTGTSGWTDIANAITASYTPVAADAGKYLRLAVTRTNIADQSGVTASSAASSQIQSFSSGAGTTVGTHITTNTTWTAAGNPYKLSSCLTVDAGKTLTIDEGVLVKIADGCSFTVLGTLDVNGTAAKQVMFTTLADDGADGQDSNGNGSSAPAPGSWTTLTLSPSSTLDYAFVAYGGAGTNSSTGNIEIDSGSPALNHVSVYKSKTSGVLITGGSPTIDAGDIESNGLGVDGDGRMGDGIRVANANPAISTTLISNNGTNGITVTESGSYTGDAPAINHNSIVLNHGYGLSVNAPTTLDDSQVAAGTGNNIWDNGMWPGDDNPEPDVQLSVSAQHPDTDWTGNAWGVSSVPAPDCGMGTFGDGVETGHIHNGGSAPLGSPVFWGLPRMHYGPVSTHWDVWTSPFSESPPIYIEGPRTHNSSAHYKDNEDEPYVTYSGCENDLVQAVPGLDEADSMAPMVAPPVFGGETDQETYGNGSNCPGDDDGAMEHRSACDDSLPKQTQQMRGDPVNTATGGLVEGDTDLSLPSLGFPLEWTRTYNSNDATVGILGPQWQASYGARLSIAVNGDVTYIGSNGAETLFKKAGAKNFTPARSEHSDLFKEDDGTYTLTTSTRRVFTFSSTGKLTSIALRNGQTMSFTYTSGKLTSITDTAGRTATVTYDSTTGYVQRVTLADGRYVEYGYDTDGMLGTVLDVTGHTTHYYYDSEGKLTSVVDPRGNTRLAATYDSTTDRVTSETDAEGDVTHYGYDLVNGVTTTVLPEGGTLRDHYSKNVLLDSIDALGRTTTYKHDGALNLTAITDAAGNTTTIEYDRDLVTNVEGPAPLSLQVSYEYDDLSRLRHMTNQNGDTAIWVYDGNGDLSWLKDFDGKKTSYTYNSFHLPITKTDALTNTTTFTYDSYGHIASVTTPLGAKTTFGYDAGGRQTSMTTARGNLPGATASLYTTHYGYDDADHLTSATDPYGHESDSTYDADGNLATLSDALAHTTTYAYDDADRLHSVTNAKGAVTSYAYTDDGQTATITNPLGTTSFDYDLADRVISSTSPAGNESGADPAQFTATYLYDALGRRVSTIGPDGSLTSDVYDVGSRPVIGVDPNGKVATATFDDNGNELSSTDPYGNVTSWTYDKMDRVKTVTDPMDAVTSYLYDAVGRTTQKTDASGGITKYEFDADGRQHKVISPLGNVTGGTPANYTWTYDFDLAAGSTTTTDPLGNQTTSTIDRAGRVASRSDANGHAVTYSYDENGNLATVSQTDAGTTAYTYDELGDIATRTDANSHVTSYEYFNDGLLKKVTNPLGKHWDFTYNSAGNVDTVVTPAGATNGTVTYGYDAYGRKTDASFSDGTAGVSLAYDPNGRLASMIDGIGTTSYAYDDAGRLTGVSRGSDAMHATYDDAGRVIARSLPDGSVTTVAHTATGQVNEVEDAGASTAFHYDAAGQLTSETLPNDTETFRSYDPAGRLNDVLNTAGASLLSEFSYSLDGVGNPNTETTTRPSGTATDAFTYDQLNRLTKTCYGVTTCSGATSYIGYAYDGVGNRTSQSRVGVSSAGTTSYTYNSADQMTAAGSASYGYDDAGNQTSAGSDTFTYNLANQMTASTVGGTSSAYTYDGNGQRASETTGSTTTSNWYDGGNLVLERNGPSLVRRYDYGPIGPIAVTNATGTFDYQTDGLGSVTDVTDSTGAAQWLYAYEPYGAPRTTSNVSGTAPDNPLGFSGGYRDPSGNYHLGARQYDPATGRFGGLDPMASAVGDPLSASYVYVNDRPGVGTDLAGTFTHEGQMAESQQRVNNIVSGIEAPRHAIGLAWQMTNPIVGGVTSAQDALDALRCGDYTAAGLAAMGAGLAFIPGGEGGLTRLAGLETKEARALLEGEEDAARVETATLKRIAESSEYTAAHSARVSETAAAIARDLGYDERTVAKMRRADEVLDTAQSQRPDHLLDPHRAATSAEHTEAVQHRAAEARGGARFIAGSDGIVDTVGSSNSVSLGRFPAYLRDAEASGSRAFNVGDNWKAMVARADKFGGEGPGSEVWIRNSRFLDDAVARGSTIRLASDPFAPENVGSFFLREVDYLAGRGYVVSGSRMVPG